MKKLRVVTLNLLFDDLRRWERLDLAVAEIKRLNPHIIMLQEVNVDAGVPKKLAKLLPDYHLEICRRPGRDSWIAQVILSKQKPLSDDRLDLNQNRVAQKVTFKIGPRKVNFINVHLYFNPFRDKARRLQVKQLLEFAGSPAVIAGDFNALPAYGSVRLMKKRFNSAYGLVHGHEPVRAYPSDLRRGPSLHHNLRLYTFKAIEVGLGRVWKGTIDYIFVEQGIKVKKCGLAFDKPSPQDPRLYASDHFGLVADLEL